MTYSAQCYCWLFYVHVYINIYDVHIFSRKIVKWDVTKNQDVTWMATIPEIGILTSLDIYPKEAVPGKYDNIHNCYRYCIFVSRVALVMHLAVGQFNLPLN